LAANNGNDSIAAALAEISENLTKLVQDEIALAKAEVSGQVRSLSAGVAAIAAGAVFGIFAVVFLLEALAWGLNGLIVSGTGALFIGFFIVFVVLLALAVFAAWFAWHKLKVGVPTPSMAIDEAKKISATVTSARGQD